MTTPPEPMIAPYVELVITSRSPIVVDSRAVGPGDRITTDPDTAAGLIAHRFAVPNNTDQEVD